MRRVGIPSTGGRCAPPGGALPVLRVRSWGGLYAFAEEQYFVRTETGPVGQRPRLVDPTSARERGEIAAMGTLVPHARSFRDQCVDTQIGEPVRLCFGAQEWERHRT